MIQKLYKAYAFICARGVWLLGQSRWRNRFQKQSFPDSKLGVLFNKAVDLQLYWKETTTQMFSLKFAKFLGTSFLTEEFHWLLLRFNSCFQRSSMQKTVQLSGITTTFRSKMYLLPRKCRSSHRTCFVKEGLQGPAQIFSSEYCEIFKNTYFWKT